MLQVDCRLLNIAQVTKHTAIELRCEIIAVLKWNVTSLRAVHGKYIVKERYILFTVYKTLITRKYPITKEGFCIYLSLSKDDSN